MRHSFYIAALAASLSLFSSCADFLDRTPDQILTEEQVFSDPKMIQSVLANLYGRQDWGQRITDDELYKQLDEACKSDGGPDNTQNFDFINDDNNDLNNKWRVYDYVLIRNINEFLRGLRASAALDDAAKATYEGQVRFLRAWTYFNMARTLGGMPIIGDEVFAYEQGMDVSVLQYPRSTEAEIYDYIIAECTAVAPMLSDKPTINGGVANKWAALSLKARAAVYAGSLAKYNNLMPSPIRTAGGEVGISADKAPGYYQTALATAKEIIAGGRYKLQDKNADKGVNFYEAVCVKDNNQEVIWARDYKYPGETHGFTTRNIPGELREEIDASVMTPILNLVEAYEFADDRNGELRLRDANGEYIPYDNAIDVFKGKDARLAGTIMLPGSTFRSRDVVFQAGRKYKDGGVWKDEVGALGSKDAKGNIITALNGPTETNDQNVNKTGFAFRKFMDETIGSGTRGRGSEMWYVRFRYAEVLLIAAEASMELGQTGEALGYINQIRERAGIQKLTTITLDDIVNENRVEFAFEDHRLHDLRRWRLAHKVWDGVVGATASHYVLFPYRVNQPGSPLDGKWVFDKKLAHMTAYPRYFKLQNYYGFIKQDWINKNPKLVKNPYQ